MATSGSVDFSVSRDDIIRDALESIGFLSPLETIDAADITTAARKLNMIVKQWQGAGDFSRGLKLWARKRATVFLQKNQSSYSLGPTGDHASATTVSTTLTANAATSATSLAVASITGIVSGDNIGVVLDSGSIHWTTVNGAPSGTTVVITTGLASAAASGKAVYTYTTKMRRPISIISATLRSSSNIDSPMEPMLVTDYEAISNKTADGTPYFYYYEAQLANGVIYLDIEPSDVTSRIKLVYLSAIEDFDAAADTPDYPQEWFRALSAQLAIDLCPSYKIVVSQELKLIRDESLAIAQNANPETSNLYFQPGLD